MSECGAIVYWWDGEYEGGCGLPRGHEPDDVHYDGLCWYNDNNEEIPEPSEDVQRQLRALGAAGEGVGGQT